MDCSSFLQIIGSIFWNTIYKMCLHIYTSTHLRLHISKSKVKGFGTSCIRITCYGLLFVSPNHRIHILEHHLQNVSTHLHIHTSTHLRLHFSKGKVKGLGTACIRITFYGLLFISPNRRIHILEHHLQNVSTHLHIYTSTHLHIWDFIFQKAR
jgi:hypothetical protein